MYKRLLYIQLWMTSAVYSQREAEVVVDRCEEDISEYFTERVLRVRKCERLGRQHELYVLQSRVTVELWRPRLMLQTDARRTYARQSCYI